MYFRETEATCRDPTGYWKAAFVRALIKLREDENNIICWGGLRALYVSSPTLRSTVAFSTVQAKFNALRWSKYIHIYQDWLKLDKLPALGTNRACPKMIAFRELEPILVEKETFGPRDWTRNLWSVPRTQLH